MLFEATAQCLVQGIEVTPNNLFISAFTLADTCQAAELMSAMAFSIRCDVWDWAKESVDWQGPILDEMHWQ